MSVPPELLRQLQAGGTMPPITPLTPTGQLYEQLAIGPGSSPLNLGTVSHTPIRPFGLPTGPVSNIMGGGGPGGININPPMSSAGYPSPPRPVGVNIRPGGLRGIGGAGLPTFGPAVPPAQTGILASARNLFKMPVGRAALMKTGAAGLGVGIAGNFAGDKLGGDETFIGRLLKGAGPGATVGALGGPWGIAGGALATGLFNAIAGGDKTKPSKWIQDDTLDRVGYTEEDKKQVQLMYDILVDIHGEEKANEEIGNLVLTDLQNRQMLESQERAEQTRMLSSQALAAQFFQPFTQQMLDSAQQRYQLTESLADQLPEGYRAVARANNVAALDNATRVATAYAAQSQLIPQQAALEMQHGLAQQLAQQQAAQVMAEMLGGGQQTGSLTDLASQIGLQNSGG